MVRATAYWVFRIGGLATLTALLLGGPARVPLAVGCVVLGLYAMMMAALLDGDWTTLFQRDEFLGTILGGQVALIAAFLEDHKTFATATPALFIGSLATTWVGVVVTQRFYRWRLTRNARAEGAHRHAVGWALVRYVAVVWNVVAVGVLACMSARFGVGVAIPFLLLVAPGAVLMVRYLENYLASIEPMPASAAALAQRIGQDVWSYAAFCAGVFVVIGLPIGLFGGKSRGFGGQLFAYALATLATGGVFRFVIAPRAGRRGAGEDRKSLPLEPRA